VFNLSPLRKENKLRSAVLMFTATIEVYEVSEWYQPPGDTGFPVAHISLLLFSVRIGRRLLEQPKVTTIFYKVETTAPTMSPTRVARPTKLTVCTAVQPEDTAHTTDLEFYFIMETDTANVTKTAAIDVASRVSGSAIDAVVSSICLNENTDRGLLLELAGCVLSVTSGTSDTRIISCEPTTNTSKSCSWFRGSLRVLHTDACSAAEVDSATIAALTKINATNFVASVNPSGSSIKVTKVEFSEAPGETTPVGAVTNMSQEGGRGQLPVPGVFTIMLTLVATMLLFFVARRRGSSSASKQIVDTTMHGTDRSVETKLTDDGSYVVPAWGGLGGSHSSVDSHCCNSALCSVCRVPASGVQMLLISDKGGKGNMQSFRSFSQDQDDSKNPLRLMTSIDTDHKSMRVHGLAKKDRATVTEDVLAVPDRLAAEKLQVAWHSSASDSSLSNSRSLVC
jgi:hypothetical protein